MAMDYRDAKSYKSKPEARLIRSGVLQPRWWQVPEEELANAVMDVGGSLEMQGEDRLQAMIRFARLYLSLIHI